MLGAGLAGPLSDRLGRRKLALDAWGPGTVFLGYAAIGLIATAFVLRFVTETKERSLEEIETDLQEATGLGERHARTSHASTR